MHGLGHGTQPSISILGALPCARHCPKALGTSDPYRRCSPRRSDRGAFPSWHRETVSGCTLLWPPALVVRMFTDPALPPSVICRTRCSAPFSPCRAEREPRALLMPSASSSALRNQTGLSRRGLASRSRFGLPHKRTAIQNRDQTICDRDLGNLARVAHIEKAHRCRLHSAANGPRKRSREVWKDDYIIPSGSQVGCGQALNHVGA